MPGIIRPILNGTKQCSRCEVFKPLAEFYIHKVKKWVGRESVCKPCKLARKKTFPPSQSIEERFWKKVVKGDGCWEWIGGKSSDGYGAIYVGGPTYQDMTHKVSYCIHYGLERIPAGKIVLHTCDNPGCVRPDHLRLGTIDENMKDMARKERCGGNKLTSAQVLDIRRRLSTGERYCDLARAYAVTGTTIYSIDKGRIWKHLLPEDEPEKR